MRKLRSSWFWTKMGRRWLEACCGWPIRWRRRRRSGGDFIWLNLNFGMSRCTTITQRATSTPTSTNEKMYTTTQWRQNRDTIILSFADSESLKIRCPRFYQTSNQVHFQTMRRPRAFEVSFTEQRPNFLWKRDSVDSTKRQTKLIVKLCAVPEPFEVPFADAE